VQLQYVVRARFMYTTIPHCIQFECNSASRSERARNTRLQHHNSTHQQWRTDPGRPRMSPSSGVASGTLAPRTVGAGRLGLEESEGDVGNRMRTTGFDLRRALTAEGCRWESWRRHAGAVERGIWSNPRSLCPIARAGKTIGRLGGGNQP
jgi:hypothetical protein